MLFNRKTDEFLANLIDEKCGEVDYLAEKKRDFYKSQAGNINELSKNTAEEISEYVDAKELGELKNYVEKEIEKNIEIETEKIKKHKKDVEKFIRNLHEKCKSNEEIEKVFNETCSYINGEIKMGETTGRMKDVLWHELKKENEESFFVQHYKTMELYRKKNLKILAPKLSDIHRRIYEKQIEDSFGCFATNFMDI